ncbi:MAG: FAD-dependent oxidoreductase [Candidatus Coatesbacteria bacterium]|nr:FAD-dependent oxidoreductase [Candidatus Coatesbacteria bacterium]
MSNNSQKIVVIGAQAAGLGAAAAAKKLNRKLNVTVLEQSIYASSSPCGLPYFVGGEIEDVRKLTFAEPAIIRDRMGIDLRLEHKALSINTKAKCVTCTDINESQYVLEYDRLIIATGASPKVPPVEGVDAEGVFTLRNIGDAERIRNYIADNSPRKAVVVGAGYIGLEMAEALTHLGLEVTVLEMLPQILTSMDPDMAEFAQQHLENNGLLIKTNSALEKIVPNERGSVGSVVAAGGTIDADIVILALGVRPNISLAKEAGIEIGECGAIAVDEGQRTSVPDVFAAGDCCQSLHIVSGRQVCMPLATVAEKQARVAGENAAGGNAKSAGILGTSISGAFGMVFASTGLITEAAKNHCSGALSQAFMGHSHAAYYPNPRPLKLKLIFDQSTGRILGAQAVGEEGALARINALISATYAGLTVADLAQLDLPYAPPFGSSWDPIHVVSMMAMRRVRLSPE